MSGIKGTGFKTHNTQSQPFNINEIISDAITNAIWNGDMEFWKASEGWAGDRGLNRELTSDEIYKWVNENPGEIDKRTGRRHTEYFHNGYLRGMKTPDQTKNYIILLKNIVNGRKKVLDKYKKATSATQLEIYALEQKFKLPDDVRDWLKTQDLTESEKNLFNLMQSADSSAGSDAEATTTDASANAEATTTGASADAGGRRRRKTSFRRRRMSRYRSSKSKSKSKKSRKSRKCVR